MLLLLWDNVIQQNCLRLIDIHITIKQPIVYSFRMFKFLTLIFFETPATAKCS
jgi:hypothetical protein